MSYQQALEAAGATVIDFESFGSYQGDWFAIVIFKGLKGIVQGTFGSCSGCDAFEAEFDDIGVEFESEEEKHEKLKQFGLNYLKNNIVSINEAIKYAEQNKDWDMEAKEMISWLKSLHDVEFNNKLLDILK